MRKNILGIIVLLIVTFALPVLASTTVTNVVARQETDGSQRVVITYNVSDPTNTRVYVTVKASSDDGASFGITPSYLSGDVGWVRPGNSKRIVWDCGRDLPGAKGDNYRVQITADATYSGGDGIPGQMVYIPAGSFLMGNNGSEPYSNANELPQHSVYLSGYWIGKYEVTRGEYRKFMEAGGYSNSAYWSADGWSWRLSHGWTQPAYWADVQYWGTPPGTFTQTDNHPVVGVTYYEAEAYCNWAGGHLPTEAQWEKAARWTGSYPRVYPWGDTWDAQKCNNSNDSLYLGYQTAPVGSYPLGKSPYGCHDMAGNVWEWVKDWYGDTYYSQTPPGGWVNPQGPSTGSYRVLRGGSWHPTGGNPRCAYRGHGGGPSGSWSYGGFRFAR